MVSSPAQPARQPLAGVKVLDFSRVLAGPFCTAMLSDMGAEIIKVEPPAGDDQRNMGAFKNGISVNFELFNRNKRSIRLDLKSDKGRDITRALAARCDVVVENFRPGVTAKLGIDYASLKEIREDLVYCSISGFGQNGPLAGFASYDVIAQALSGLMSITGEKNREPMLVGDSVGDTVTGIYAAWAIVNGLYRRAMTGQGALIDVAMFDSLFSLLPTALAQWQVTGEAPGRQGNHHPLSAPFGAYGAADGNIIIAIANNSLFARFASVIGQPTLVDDPRFGNDQLRHANRAALKEAIESWSTSLPAQQAAHMLGEAGIPASVVWNVAQAALSEHAEHRGLLTELPHDILGKVHVPEQPAHMDGLRRGQSRKAPKLGGDGAEILRDILGMNNAEIARMQNDNVI